MEPLIAPPAGYRVKVDVHKGASLQTLMERTKQVINQWPCEAVYIFGGICSITKKEGASISLQFNTDEDTYQAVKGLYKAVITDLDKYDDTPVILCQLTGADLKTANEDPRTRDPKKRKRGKKHPSQDDLDKAIVRLNEYIKILNTERARPTPRQHQ